MIGTSSDEKPVYPPPTPRPCKALLREPLEFYTGFPLLHNNQWYYVHSACYTYEVLLCEARINSLAPPPF